MGGVIGRSAVALIPVVAAEGLPEEAVQGFNRTQEIADMEEATALAFSKLEELKAAVLNLSGRIDAVDAGLADL